MPADVNPLADPSGFIARTAAVAQGSPFIAQLHGHFVIVDRIEEGVVYFRDPWGLGGPGSPSGLEATLNVSDFVDRWYGGKLGIVVWWNKQ